MNILDLELFDLTANNLHAALKKLDKFYLNEKSLADYLEYMSDKPLEEWLRFQPSKKEGERAALQDISHFAALLITLQTKLYEQYIEITGSVAELLDQSHKDKAEIERLKKSLIWYVESLDIELKQGVEILQIVLDKK
jgi:hypothetical protein